MQSKIRLAKVSEYPFRQNKNKLRDIKVMFIYILL